MAWSCVSLFLTKKRESESEGNPQRQDYRHLSEGRWQNTNMIGPPPLRGIGIKAPVNIYGDNV